LLELVRRYGYDAANLIEGDNVLVISSGYFGKRFKDILDRYGQIHL
jgi:aspartate aminotransferase-like enzyme